MAVSSFKRSLYTSNPDKYTSFLAGNEAYDPGAFVSIATVTSSGSSATLSFTSIPSTYSSLQIRFMYRYSAAVDTTNTLFTVNSDSGSNYAFHEINGNGTTVAASGTATTTAMRYGRAPGTTTAANIFGVGIMDIHDYASTTKYKTFRTLYGCDANTGTTAYPVRLFSGLWQNTNAISTITFPAPSGTWASGTVFSLYGIKGN
jgi:hypothetical protein